MFSMSQAVQYVDIFAPKTGIDSGLMTVFTVLVCVGFLTALASAALEGRAAALVMILGITGAIGGIIGITVQQVNSVHAQQDVLKGMASNVKEKYHADLKTEYAGISDLDKVKTYWLTFDNGAYGAYSMKFLESGEPVIVENPDLPSVQELNGEATPSTVPTKPEESAKK